jgi:hypothetical protein
MNTVSVTALTLVALSIGSLYAPRLLLGQSKRLSREDLIKAQPRLAWIRWVYPFLYAVWVLLLLTLCVVLINLLMNRIGQRVFYLAGLFLAGAAVFDGIFAVLTGIRPLPTPGGYLFVYRNKTHFVNGLQILLGLAVVTVAVFLAFA